MRAEMTGAVCSPKDCPATLEIEPTALGIELEGEPNASLSPTTVDLPQVSVSDIRIRITPPDLTLEATKHFGGVLGALFATGDNLIDSFLDVFSNTDDLAEVAKLNFGSASIEVDAFDVELGDVRVHGLPVTDDVRPVELRLDFDEAKATALFRGFTTRLLGCLTLNGGDCDCTGKDHEPPPAAALTPAITLVEAGKSYEPVIVHGQNFGSQPGRLVVTSGGTILVAEIGEWTPTLIKAQVADLESGTHTVQVVTADGLFSNTSPFQVF